jgi:hypothetical protein
MQKPLRGANNAYLQLTRHLGLFVEVPTNREQKRLRMKFEIKEKKHLAEKAKRYEENKAKKNNKVS